MIRASRHQTSSHSTSLAWLLVTLMLVAGGTRNASASIDTGIKPTNMTDEQFYQLAVQAAERDLVRKTNVAMQRFEKRQAMKASMVAGMKSQFKQRRELINQQLLHTPLETVADEGYGFAGYVLWVLVAGIAGFFGWQYYKNRETGGSQSEDSPFITTRSAQSLVAPHPKSGHPPVHSAGTESPRFNTNNVNLTATAKSAGGREVAPPSASGSQNCYSCGKQTPIRHLEKVNFCGETFAMCPSCAKQHHNAWATN